jgi:hypothetical protein
VDDTLSGKYHTDVSEPRTASIIREIMRQYASLKCLSTSTRRRYIPKGRHENLNSQKYDYVFVLLAV